MSDPALVRGKTESLSESVGNASRTGYALEQRQEKNLGSEESDGINSKSETKEEVFVSVVRSLMDLDQKKHFTNKFCQDHKGTFFSEMLKKAESGSYSSIVDIKDDFLLICDCALAKYNGRSIQYRTAKKMKKRGIARINGNVRRLRKSVGTNLQKILPKKRPITKPPLKKFDSLQVESDLGIIKRKRKYREDNIPDAEYTDKDRLRRLVHSLIRLDREKRLVYPVSSNDERYYENIKDPLFLNDMKRKEEAGEYSNVAMIREDFYQVMENAIKFYPETTRIYKAAKEMRVRAESMIGIWKYHYRRALMPIESPEESPEGLKVKYDSVARTFDISEKIHRKELSIGQMVEKRLFMKIFEELLQIDGSDELYFTPHIDEAPSYYELIERPIALQNIKKKIKRGEYQSLVEIEADVRLMCANCKKYNIPESEMYEIGRSFLNRSLEVFQDYFKLLRNPDASSLDILGMDVGEDVSRFPFTILPLFSGDKPNREGILNNDDDTTKSVLNTHAGATQKLIGSDNHFGSHYDLLRKGENPYMIDIDGKILARVLKDTKSISLENSVKSHRVLRNLEVPFDDVVDFDDIVAKYRYLAAGGSNQSILDYSFLLLNQLNAQLAQRITKGDKLPSEGERELHREIGENLFLLGKRTRPSSLIDGVNLSEYAERVRNMSASFLSDCI